MKSYAVFDLHCDTLTDCMYTNTGNMDTLDDPKRVLRLSNMPEGVNWAQFYAVWIQDGYRGPAAMEFFDRCADSFDRQMKRFSDRVSPCRSGADVEAAWAEGKRAAVLTVENGSVLGGKMENLQHLVDRGVKCMTLVWNGKYEIGSGQLEKGGLTGFGKELIPEMEKAGILVDVSHLNDQGFEDLIGIVKKPFTATHSNARAICSHKRNLTDDMIKEMVSRGCLIGMNYYIDFICDNGEDAKTPDSLYRHIEHFLELGAEDCLALGSDYDGCTLPEFLSTPEKVAEFYGYMLERGLPAETADKVFYKNAIRFLKETL